MTKDQKDYLEKNITLLINNEFEKFFELAPPGIGNILYEADIDFLPYMQRIPRFAFYGNDKLQSFDIPDNIKVIEDYSFDRCENLTNVTISNSVNKFTYGCFKDCKSLTHIILPQSITKIGAKTFEGCTSLKKILFEGTVQQWQKAEQRMDAFREVPARTIECIDGVTKLRH